MTTPHWRITDHVCRLCLGRILTRTLPDGAEESRCAECGSHAPGDHRSLCACGARLRNDTDARLRCVPNPEKRPEVSAEIIVALESVPVLPSLVVATRPA